MLTIKYQTTFKKDYKRIVKRGYDIRLLEEVITILAEQKPLPENYRDHNLSGNYAGCRECHITPDWLLIYEIQNPSARSVPKVVDAPFSYKTGNIAGHALLMYSVFPSTNIHVLLFPYRQTLYCIVQSN